MQDQIKRAINLAKKTGDRLIIVDKSRPEDNFVVMTLEQYEQIVLSSSGIRNLTEDELLDKINRDIAIWKSNKNFDIENRFDMEKNDEFGDFDDLEDDDEDFEEENLYYFDEDDEFDDFDEDFTDFQVKNKKKNDIWDLPEFGDFDDYEETESSSMPSKKKAKNAWSIPGAVKKGAEVVEDDIF